MVKSIKANILIHVQITNIKQSKKFKKKNPEKWVNNVNAYYGSEAGIAGDA